MPTSSSKDLGLTAAMVSGTIPPTNTDLLWLDITTNPSIKKYYDPNDGLWKPLIAINQIIGNGITSISLGKQVVFVSVSGNDYTGTVGDLSKSFNTVGGAYAYAKTLLPTVLNQIIIAVYPGTYLENLTLDTDYINIVSATPQNIIYNDGLATLINNVSFDVLKRKYIINGTVTIITPNVNIKGIDIRTLVIKPLTTSAIFIENMICQTISNPVSAIPLKASFYDVHAETFLNSDTQTDLVGSFIMCGGNNAFRSGIATYNGSVWYGGIQNSYFELCYGGSGSMGGLGGYINNTTILNCKFGNNCISTIDNSNLNNVILGNACIKSATNTTFLTVTGGSDCCKDFTDIIAQDCIFGVDFGKNGVLDFLSGNLDNVTSDFSNGFANGRPFWGKMRRMFIRATNALNSALNIATPVDNGVNRQPSTIEHSTILFCTSDPTTKSSIDGTFAYVSYCKFNVAYTVVNVLGSDNDSNNIINANLCNYVTTVCPIPTLFTLVTSSFVTGTPIDFVFNYQMSVARAGSQIEMTTPYGIVTITNIVGNNGGLSSGTLTIHINIPLSGAYQFRLRTICGYDSLGNVSSFSSWTPMIVANVTNLSRATAWRAKAPTVYCILSALPQNPIYAILTAESPSNSDITSTAPPYHERVKTNYSKFRLYFFSDAGLSTPLNIINQDFVVFIKNKNTTINSYYSNTNNTDTPDSINTQTIEGVTTLSFTGITGASVLLNAGFDYQTSVETRDTTSFSGATVDRQTSMETIIFDLFVANQIFNSPTGYKEWTTLEQYYTDNSTATGTTKDNVSTDPDYIAPVNDLTLCPIDTPSTRINLGTSLYVTTVNFVTGATTKAPDLGGVYDSSSGGDVFVIQSFKGQPTTLSVKVDTYYVGAVTTPGKIQVVITHDGGVSTQIAVNRGVLTTLGTFIDITSVNISNF